MIRSLRRQYGMEQKDTSGLVQFSSGMTSSKVPRYDLIPPWALRRLAGRFETGLEKHKEKTWNARKAKHPSLTDLEVVRYRICHVIEHANKLLEKLDGVRPDDGDDDASAIAWGGIFLCEATDELREQGFFLLPPVPTTTSQGMTKLPKAKK